MLGNPFKLFKSGEWILLAVSLLIIVASNLLNHSMSILVLAGTVIGIVSLVMLAVGSAWGQILMIVFSVLYALNSYRFHYYGEMITYLGMTLPISLFTLIVWLRHPDHGGKSVEIKKLTAGKSAFLFVSTVVVTACFYFVLKRLQTPNIVFSTVSIATSYIAAALMLLRSSWYAVGYAANDAVLIILWILASIEDKRYIPMIVCFAVLLANDLYGFISWRSRERLNSFIDAQSADAEK